MSNVERGYCPSPPHVPYLPLRSTTALLALLPSCYPSPFCSSPFLQSSSVTAGDFPGCPAKLFELSSWDCSGGLWSLITASAMIACHDECSEYFHGPAIRFQAAGLWIGCVCATSSISV
eukprot:TRINITY_DN6126_c0_g1_i1.p1 TRINITY_DN6126_c0_g1~~TRINITY_DN6126_c0_g1_i1.p1  ORF type:complete len:119 (-),score=3.09 TRINITY_DN6126_c0_g1_i1:115-471(-)